MADRQEEEDQKRADFEQKYVAPVLKAAKPVASLVAFITRPLRALKRKKPKGPYAISEARMHGTRWRMRRHSIAAV